MVEPLSKKDVITTGEIIIAVPSLPIVRKFVEVGRINTNIQALKDSSCFIEIEHRASMPKETKVLVKYIPLDEVLRRLGGLSE